MNTWNLENIDIIYPSINNHADYYKYTSSNQIKYFGIQSIKFSYDSYKIEFSFGEISKGYSLYQINTVKKSLDINVLTEDGEFKNLNDDLKKHNLLQFSLDKCTINNSKISIMENDDDYNNTNEENYNFIKSGIDCYPISYKSNYMIEDLEDIDINKDRYDELENIVINSIISLLNIYYSIEVKENNNLKETFINVVNNNSKSILQSSDLNELEINLDYIKKMDNMLNGYSN
jgi:hypothetical protein